MLDLGHGFYDTKRGERYTISPSARDYVHDRLLTLNLKRFKEENKAGLNIKKACTKSSQNQPADDNGSEQQDDLDLFKENEQ